MTKKIVLTVSVHYKWGPVLLPVLVEEKESGGLGILETAQKSFSDFPDLNKAARELIILTEKYTDKSLLKSYSKEKTLKEFYASVTDETIETYIRPFIERCHQKIIKLFPESGLKLYFRDEIKRRELWPADLISVPSQASSVMFTFEKDSNGLRYYLRIEGENGLTDLYARNCTILCREPAIILTNRELLFFEDIDIKKLMPFFSKKLVEIPSLSEKTYIKTFVRNCIINYKVNFSGLDITEIKPEKEAFLSFESDWNRRPVLIASISYEGEKYPLDHNQKKIVHIEENSENVSLRWFYPDKIWEKQLVSLLTENGLQQTGPSTFSLPEHSDLDNEEEIHGMVDWLRAHQDVTAAFNFTQNQIERTYYIGEISVEISVDAKQDWFDMHCIVVFGDFKIPFNRFRHHILENIREYVLPDGTIAVLPEEWFSRYYELMFFSKDDKDCMILKKNQYKIAEVLDSKISYPTLKTVDLPEVPTSLHANLLNYQITGFQWMVWLYKQGFGGCLADDMGLGKTVQTIALLEYIENEQKDLAGALKNGSAYPKSLNKENSSIRDISGSQLSCGSQLSLFDTDSDATNNQIMLPSIVVMPTSLLYNWQNELRRFAPNLKVHTYSGAKRLKSKDIGLIFRHYNVILTTYGILRNDIELLSGCLFHHMILDESQYVKNPDSQTYKAVRQIQALHKIALTGTPVENSLTDLWAQLNILNENMLGSYTSFRNVYLNPINKEDKEKEASLLRMIHPFLLRRTKQEVTPDLPQLQERIVYCDMSPAQEACYKKEKNQLRSSLLDDKTWDNPHQLSILTLQGLTRLRLLANHPALVNPEYKDDSGKFDQIVMRLETLRSEGHKVLVFSSFVKHLRLLASCFEKEDLPYAWLIGSTPVDDREKEINRFMHDPSVSCFFISLKAGGVGLNLTAADYVFIIDPWWNPASEMQAISRSHRIGQDKKVIVYRFLSCKTIEEKIRRLQESKSKLASTFVRSGNPLSELSREEIGRLIE